MVYQLKFVNIFRIYSFTKEKIFKNMTKKPYNHSFMLSVHNKIWGPLKTMIAVQMYILNYFAPSLMSRVC